MRYQNKCMAKLLPLDALHGCYKENQPAYPLLMTNPPVGPAFLALFLVAMAIPAHAGVYKTVDKNGQVHYADQPANSGGSTQLHMQSAPKPPKHAAPSGSQDESEESRNEYARQQYLQKMEEGERLRAEANAKRDAADRAAEEKRVADMKRWAEQRAESQKRADDATIARCQREGQIYCDQGVDKIRREDELRRADDELEKSMARRRRY